MEINPIAMTLVAHMAVSEAEFRARVVMVKERMESKEQEILGQWLTVEKMEHSGDFTPCFGGMEA